MSESLNGVTYRSLLLAFVEKVLEIYPPERIIINRGYLCNSYYDTKGSVHSFPSKVIQNNLDINKKLSMLYSEVEALLPPAHVIDICDSYIGYEGNKWGLANTHYEDEYYHMAAELLKCIVDSKQVPYKAKAALLKGKLKKRIKRIK